ncbi:hypothetical protein ACFQ7F_32760 [Streptomyces sp. NPDC056486]|uniref:hypothetical protein n=1 Tax=Streptomyces sp. NPDC056486 TaxID=3345835 RepID=UPI00368F6947
MTLGGHMGHIERPRRIVQTGQQLTPGLGKDQRTTRAPGTAGPNRELYRARARPLLDAVTRLDAGLDEGARRQLAEWIGDEYRTAYGDVPLGLVARCHLGPPYIDHVLNLFHVILRHFAPAEPMPEPFAQARMLARSDGYAYIEVYDGGLILPVLADGTVVRP